MFLFPKKKRLLQKKNYDDVFECHKKTITSEFIIFYRTNDLKHPRLGLALSKKMIPKACERNRVKRIIRESFRHQSLPSVDVVFLARLGVRKKTNRELHVTLNAAWRKILDTEKNSMLAD